MVCLGRFLKMFSYSAVLTTPECEKVEVVEEEDGDSPRRSSKRKKLKGFDGEDSRSTPSCTAISVVQGEPSLFLTGS
jgi:hypothetical protein